jgi:hypothetical protein
MHRLLLSLLMVTFLSGCGSKDASNDAVAPEAGQAWWVDISAAEVIEPAGADGIVALIQGDYALLTGAINVTESDFGMLFALAGEDGTQDHCNRTIAMNGINLNSDGSFEFGPEDFTIANGIHTEDLELTGTFSADLSSINDITLKGWVQVSSIPEDLLPLDGMDVCELLETIDISCVRCRDGSRECLHVHTEGLTGELRESVSLEEITEADGFDDCTDDTGGR